MGIVISYIRIPVDQNKNEAPYWENIEFENSFKKPDIDKLDFD